MSREIIITGGDAHFFPFLISALNSLRAFPETASRDFGIIDQGLQADQIAQLESLGCRIVQPEWTLPVPEDRRLLRNIGLVARTALRDYFPGYEVYLWFDADAWMQTPEFMHIFMDGARANGAAVVLENGPGYRRPLSDLKWWAGNMIAAYGAMAGLRLSVARSINIGILCLRDNAPHWDAWIRAYTRALERTGKVNLDQHAFLAAIHLDGLATTFLPARYNWLPHLSRPVWNQETRLLCEPVSPYRPLSVIHLAGPRKDRPYEITSLSGGTLTTPLTYPAMQRHAVADEVEPVLA
ncbi:MAG: hypothetical protein ABWY00_04315 [Dongiaceae bacterium]